MQHFLLIAILVIPILVLTILRINAALVFLSLCLGYVLVDQVANDANSLITYLAPNANSISAATWRLIMLFAPMILTCVIMIFSIKGKVKTLLNILPAAATGVLGLLLAVPLMTPGLRGTITHQALWTQLNRAQALVIGLGAFISLIFLWTQRRQAKKSE